MDSDDTGRSTKLFLIGLLHHLEQVALEVRLPSRISTAELHVSTGEGERGLNNRSQFLLAALHIRAREAYHLHTLAVSYLLLAYYSKVVTGLHDVRHLRNHTINAVRAERDSVNEEILHVLRHLGLRALHFRSLERQVGLYTVVLTQPEVLIAVHEVLYILITLFGNSDNG